ncbi:hypothetical protein [Ruminococcus albus]|uniref:Bacterial repeat domain-containing protein n=1 Tax=Ruminococcus albus TaxID=1264 RepID=A0A1H7LAW0_RUMAL|nr:hypothetical protein [Ruminococcus albus]SEK95936.1 hypothetical protein SAMN05216469_108133 [Ruminococcus albus]
MKHKFRRGLMCVVMALALVVSAFTGVFPLQCITASADDEYLTFTAEQDDSSVTISWMDSSFSLDYNNGNGWVPYSDGYTINLNQDDSVQFRGKNDNISGSIFDNNKHVYIEGRVACTGNIMTLLNYEVPGDASMSYACFSNMFLNCIGLTKAPDLPATDLSKTCYFRMFEGCSNLTKAPELPATKLEWSCYDCMFKNCTGLTKAPELPAKELDGHCYNSMFYGCTSLTELPELPATELKENCYFWMFVLCEGIKVSYERDNENYNAEYKIPSSGEGTLSSPKDIYLMFAGTGGPVQVPDINTTYYVHKYTFFREVPATCTTAGNIEYYTYGDKYYTYDGTTYTELTDLNGDGDVNIDDTVIPATTGVHTYGETSPIWTWIKENGEYTVFVKFKCKFCGDIVTPETNPSLVWVDNGNGVKTYTATINLNGHDYTSTKDEQITQSITINNNTKNYKYGEQIRADAHAMKDGKYFVGWYDVDTNTKVSGTQTYYFYATRNMRIEARYDSSAVEEEEPVYSMNVSRVDLPESGKQKISFTVDWELPEDYQLIEAGVLRSYTNDNPELDGADVSKKVSTLQTERGTFKYNLTLSAANSEKTIYSKGYVTYRNKLNDQIVTVYTAPVATAKA